MMALSYNLVSCLAFLCVSSRRLLSVVFSPLVVSVFPFLFSLVSLVVSRFVVSIVSSLPFIIA